jgi:signal transduction histidine kinase/ligand-binding sensor domain-containing protein/ActR/RegA family two-component response regulator
VTARQQRTASGPLRRLGFAGALLVLSLLVAGCGDASGPPADTALPRPTATRAPFEVSEELPSSLAALARYGQGITFEHISPDAGLSQSVVTDFLQDDQGFLWLATQDGLNRYDGTDFRIFKEDPTAANSLRGNLVASMEKAPTGEIWIGTNDGGLNRYDPRTGQFTAFPNDPQNPNSLSEDAVTAVDVDASGVVWAGTANRGLNRLDPGTGQVTRYLADPANPGALSTNNILCVLAHEDGSVWVGTGGGGLERLDPASGTFQHYPSDPSDPQRLGDAWIQTLHLDRQGTLWVGTFTGGLHRLDTETGRFTRYAHDPEDASSMGHNSVAAVFEDGSGRLWAGTQGGGLHVLDRETGRFIHYRNDASDPSSLSNDNVISIFEDSSGMLWFGTFGSGADTYDPYRQKFSNIRSRPGQLEGLSGDSVWGMVEDEEGVVWIATNGGGLNRFDPAAGKWTSYKNDPAAAESLADDTVYQVYVDRQGTLWLGTAAGLERFDRATETFRHYALPMILAIFEDEEGTFWLGSVAGLMVFDRQTGATRILAHDPTDPYSLSSDVVCMIMQDRQGRLWIGTTSGGLNRYDGTAQRFTRYVRDAQDPSSLSSNTVLAMLQAQDGTLWIGTAGGLNRFEPESGAFTAFRERDGLPNDYVYTILEDDRGDLWLSTNKGLSHFNPHQQTFRNYDRSDGLQANEFNQWAALKNRQGVMLFGGVQGISAFHPDLVHDNPFVPPVVVTDLQIYGRPVPVGPDSPLSRPVETLDAIRLAYTDNYFQFSYAALHFSSPEKIRYAYILEGLDREWTDAGNMHLANYTNVPPGDYVFRVKGTNSDQVWNEQGAALSIVIPPPFWQTGWFRILAAVGVISAISSLFLLRIRSVERQRERLEAQVQQRTLELRQTMQELARAKEAAEAASRAKSTFLANMSHEFRTPLNAILGFTQIMVRDQRLPSDQKEDLQIVHRSGEHLLGLINDVLDMSKIEAGRATLNRRAFDLHRLLQGLEEMFAWRAEGKGIDLTLDLARGVPRYVRSDDGKLRQVLMNLLGNAVKFTEEGHVQLKVQAAAELYGGNVPVRFTVQDTGPGIGREEMDHLFEPFGQTASGRQSQEGTGLGLAISQQFVRLMGGEIRVSSEPGKGSTFQFELPLEVAGLADLEAPPLARRVAGLDPGQPVYRMLVVDDQAANRRLLRKLFEPVGFQVREAANGQKALEIWDAWEPHLIWMDMRMPVMDGYEATRRIKATTRGLATAVIALTASALEEDRVLILSEGCDDYVRKPFREEELFATAARHLGVRYTYEAVPPEAGTAPDGARSPEELPLDEGEPLVARLREADPAWRDELRRATILGDLEAIHRLAGAVSAQNPELADGIISLADRYQHEQILACLDRLKT